MGALIGMVVFVAVVVWVAPSLTYNRSPLHMAFTLTAAAIVFLLTGLLGYAIKRTAGLPYLQPSHSVVWFQVWVGVAAVVLAAFFWRKALRIL